MAENCHKVTLGGGKVVLLREMKLKTSKMASKAVGNKGAGNAQVQNQETMEELARLLLVQIDGGAVSYQNLGDLDEHFTYAEFSQLSLYIGKMMGAGEDDPKAEFVTVG